MDSWFVKLVLTRYILIGEVAVTVSYPNKIKHGKGTITYDDGTQW